MFKRLMFIGAATVFVATSTGAHPASPSGFLDHSNPYAPFEFLIGDWVSSVKGEEMTVHQQFRWGPSKSYISYATYIALPGKPEQLHFEGPMVWNGKTHALDFLFVVDPGSGVQEKGTVRREADGSVIRDVQFTDSRGRTGHFRQTFRRNASDVITRVMRETEKGWVTSPPGDLVMTRQSPAAALR